MLPCRELSAWKFLPHETLFRIIFSPRSSAEWKSFLLVEAKSSIVQKCLPPSLASSTNMNDVELRDIRCSWSRIRNLFLFLQRRKTTSASFDLLNHPRAGETTAEGLAGIRKCLRRGKLEGFSCYSFGPSSTLCVIWLSKVQLMLFCLCAYWKGGIRAQPNLVSD